MKLGIKRMRKFALFAAVAGYASAGLASDGTIYTGTQCHTYSAAVGTYGEWYGALGNASTTATLAAHCPITRQQTTQPIVAGSWAKVIDRNFNEDVCCELGSVEIIGVTNVLTWSDRRCSSGTNSNVQTLTFGALSSTSVSDEYMNCSIPRVYSGSTSLLSSFKIEEGP